MRRAFGVICGSVVIMLVLGCQLDWMILDVSSNLDDSLILSYFGREKVILNFTTKSGSQVIHLVVMNMM